MLGSDGRDLSDNIKINRNNEGLFRSLKSYEGDRVCNKLASPPDKSKGAFSVRTMCEVFTS